MSPGDDEAISGEFTSSLASEKLSQQLAEIREVCTPLKQTWDEDWLGVFSCGVDGRIFRPAGSGPRGERSESEDLRDRVPLLEAVSSYLLEVRPSGGRIYISENGAHTWDDQKEAVTRFLRFQELPEGNASGAPSRDSHDPPEEQGSPDDTPREAPRTPPREEPTSPGPGVTLDSDRAGETDRNTQPEKNLYELLRSCQLGESGAIVGGHIDRDPLRRNLYIQTEEDDTVEEFFAQGYREDGKVLIITGSAGDGKSALLSRGFEEAQKQGIESLTRECIHLDATASTRKHETYDEELARFIERASHDLDLGTGPRKGLAINLGLAIDFFERQGKKATFPTFWGAIDAARGQREVSTKSVKVLNLAHRDSYDTHPESLGDGLLSDIIERFDASDPSSPLHQAYQREVEDCPAGEDCPLLYNVQQFTREEVRGRLTRLFGASALINGTYLNPRAILDRISSVMLPRELKELPGDHPVCPVGAAVEAGRSISSNALIWNSTFAEVESNAEHLAGYLDPAAQASKAVDEEILDWSADPTRLKDIVSNMPPVAYRGLADRVAVVLRRRYLLDAEGARPAVEWSWFEEFLAALTYLKTPVDDGQGDLRVKTGEVFQTVKEALRSWTGNQEGSEFIEFVDGIKSTEYRFLSKWGDPRVDPSASREETRKESMPGQLWLVLNPGAEGSGAPIPVPVSFDLYVLMQRVTRDYNPNSLDIERSEGIRLIHSRLSEFTQKHDFVRLLGKGGNEILTIERDELGSLRVVPGGR